MNDQENEVLQKDTETQPPCNNDHVTEGCEKFSETEAKPEVLTTSLSSAVFMSVTHVRNLMDLLEKMPDHSDFNMEIDEISMFLGRTMQSLNQKLV